MKRERDNKVKKSVMFIPTIVALAILGQVIFNLVVFLKQNQMDSAIKYNVDSINLLLSIVGVAITVWIGLNVYNIYTKEELQNLMKQAEKASAITSKVYTDMLISKLRVSFRDGTAKYYASRLNEIDSFPQQILEKIIDIEDIYILAYEFYSQELNSSYYEKGQSQVDWLRKFLKTSGSGFNLLSKEQQKFLQGYLSLRYADFTHFRIHYEKSQKIDLDMYEECLQGYSNGLRFLFGIKSIPLKIDVSGFSDSEQTCLAFIFNSIGFLVIECRQNSIAIKKAPNAIYTLKVAIKLSNSLTNKQRSMFYRNLGVAYEQSGEIDNAHRCYIAAYKIDRSSHKAAHCIGSLLIKKLVKRFPKLNGIQNGKLDNNIKAYIKDYANEQAEIIEALRTAAIWYEIKKANNKGITDDRIAVIYKLIYEFTKNDDDAYTAECVQRAANLQIDLPKKEIKVQYGRKKQKSHG